MEQMTFTKADVDDSAVDFPSSHPALDLLSYLLRGKGIDPIADELPFQTPRRFATEVQFTDAESADHLRMEAHKAVYGNLPELADLPEDTKKTIWKVFAEELRTYGKAFMQATKDGAKQLPEELKAKVNVDIMCPTYKKWTEEISTWCVTHETGLGKMGHTQREILRGSS
jgi:hypothetical protein